MSEQENVRIVQAVVADRRGSRHALRRAGRRHPPPGGLRVALNARGEKIGAKIRDTQLQKSRCAHHRRSRSGRRDGRSPGAFAGGLEPMPLEAFQQMALRLIRSRARAMAESGVA